MRKMSTGDDATLGNYRKWADLLIGPKATAFIDQKIAESPNGANEEVIADERQMLHLLATIEHSPSAAPRSSSEEKCSRLGY